MHKYIYFISLLTVYLNAIDPNIQKINEIVKPIEDSAWLATFENHYFNPIAKKAIGRNTRTKDIDSGLKSIAGESLEAVGIDKNTEIRKIRKNDEPFKENAVIWTAANRIYINHDLNIFSYALKKFLFAHESVHIKHHDSSMRFLLTGLTFSSIMVPGILIKHPRKTIVVATAISTLFHKKYTQFVEKRADTEGLLALDCHTCAQEIADSVASDEKNSISRPAGYLNSKQMNEIAKTMENKKCIRHGSWFGW